MIPLCTTATRPLQSTCGWALASVGWPWVAHRVWPMPELAWRRPPSAIRRRSDSERVPRAARARHSSEPDCTTTPAESYPRYSRRSSPWRSTSITQSPPVTPMMPHMAKRLRLPGRLEAQLRRAAHGLGQAVGSRRSRGLFGSLHHHPDDRLGAARPEDDPPFVPELGAHRLELPPDDRAAHDALGVVHG